MKLILQILFGTVLITMLTTCEKYSPIPKGSFGYLNADVNGKSWQHMFHNAYLRTWCHWETLNAITKCDSKIFNISSTLFTNAGFPRHQIIFSRIPAKKGHFPIRSDYENACESRDSVTSNMYVEIDDNESSGDFYTSGFNTEDFFEIEFYNSETNEIKGRFQVTMILTPNNYGHNAPDTLRFTKGQFHTRIVNPRPLYPR